MSKASLHMRARKMRSQGVSVRDIAKRLRVAKSTASLWTRDMILSEQQAELLLKRKLLGAQLGRIRGALHQKQRREQRYKDAQISEIDRLGHLSKREFLSAGTALYWAEGNKMQKKIEFCNSDPFLVNFMIRWFQIFFNLTLADFRCYVGINYTHQQRDQIVKTYWSDVTKIPLSQFTKTSFKKSKSKKIYENFDKHFGTLAVRVVKPSKIIYNVLGLIDALKHQNLSG